MIAGSVSRDWRKYLRFNLRGLVVLVFLTGAGLGWAVHSARVQRNAVAAIQGAGGSVLYDWQRDIANPGKRWVPKWLVDRVGVDYFGHVIQVTLFERASDAELLHVGNLSRLEHLSLFGPAVTDTGLANLKELTRLRTLNLQGTNVTDVGLEHLSGLTGLQRLYLHNTRVTGSGLVHLRRLTDLQVLNLNNSPVDDTGLKCLANATCLRELCLLGTRVTDAGLEHLGGLHNLKVLDVPYTAVGDSRSNASFKAS